MPLVGTLISIGDVTGSIAIASHSSRSRSPSGILRIQLKICVIENEKVSINWVLSVGGVEIT